MIQINSLSPSINITLNPLDHQKITEFTIPPKGEFKGHPDEKMLKNMYDAITRLHLWEWLKTFKHDRRIGFVYARDYELTLIRKAVMKDDHSGNTFEYAMYNMEIIAKKGWEYYCKKELY